MTWIVSSQTPLRISFIGGGTDLPEVSGVVGGAVLSIAIKQYVYVTVKKHSGLFHEAYRLQYSETEICKDRASIENDIIRETLSYFDIDEPLVINTMSDIPAQSGLGSSSSFAVGLITCLNDMFALRIPKSDIAEHAFLIERQIKDSSVGRQDAYAAATGGFNLFEFGKKSSISPVHNCQLITEKALPCMRIFWTGRSRSAQAVLKRQARMAHERLDVYKRMADLAKECYFTLSRGDQDPIHTLSGFLSINSRLKYGLNPDILPPEIERMDRSLKELGARSTKLLGAGAGGFLLSIFDTPAMAREASKTTGMTSLEIELDLIGTSLTFSR